MENDIEMVHNLLNYARDFNLVDEVVYSALKEMKDCPHLEIKEALQRACDEWDV
ncbi:MAG: hypothetical protein WC827_03715 [Candidatus Paceibacterota bacterium]|jgi:hypothetical protein